MPWDVHWSVFSPRARLFGDSGGGPLLAPLDAKSWQEQNIDSTAIKTLLHLHLRERIMWRQYDPGGI